MSVQPCIAYSDSPNALQPKKKQQPIQVSSSGCPPHQAAHSQACRQEALRDRHSYRVAAASSHPHEALVCTATSQLPTLQDHVPCANTQQHSPGSKGQGPAWSDDVKQAQGTLMPAAGCNFQAAEAPEFRMLQAIAHCCRRRTSSNENFNFKKLFTAHTCSVDREPCRPLESELYGQPHRRVIECRPRHLTQRLNWLWTQACGTLRASCSRSPS